MEMYNGKVCVTYDELTSCANGEPVIGYKALAMYLYRNPHARANVRGGLDNYALIDYSALNSRHRRRFEAKYGGDPAQLIKERQAAEAAAATGDAAMIAAESPVLKMDEQAREFYRAYRYMRRGMETALPDKLVEQYTVNASVLNMIIDTLGKRSQYRKARGGSGTGLYDTIEDLYEELRRAYGHTLPDSRRALQAKVRQYRKEGYGALVSGKIGNSNTTVITEEAGRYIIALKRSAKPIRTDAQILEEYNRQAPTKGWKQLTSLRALQLYLTDPAVEPLWYDAVHGELAAHQRYGRKHVTLLPTKRDSLWYGDGTKLNLYYREYVQGKGWQARTLQVYEVMDAYSEVLLGYHISEHEDYEAQYNAYRMAIQTSGHKPYELVHDNQGGHKKIGDFLDRITGHIHRPTAPYSGQSKTIESVFGRLQAQVLHKDWRFTGQNVNAKKSTSKSNLERIAANVEGLYTLEELKEAYAAARKEWNEMAHPATGVSRIEMYQSSCNEDTPAVTAEDMVEMFWVTTDKPSTYTDNGLKVTIKKRDYRYEVFSAPGVPDHDFLRMNRGRKFYTKYDPYDHRSVRLYTMDADGSMRFARIAEPYLVIHRAIQEQTAGERAFIATNIAANRQDRIERQISARTIEREHGVTPEQQGLRRPKMAGMTRQSAAEAEIERETRRRLRRYSAAADMLSPGKVAKEISNMLYDPDGKIQIDMRKVAGKL